MTVTSLPLERRDRGALAVIARPALTVAVLDAIWAMMLWSVVLRRVTPGQVWQGVAGAALGPSARQGGAATVVLGLAMHLTVATTWTTIYFVLVRAWPSFRAAAARTALPLGVAYGAFVWCMMDLVVIPFTHARVQPPTSGLFWVNLVGHMIVVGPPIGLWMRAEARRGRGEG